MTTKQRTLSGDTADPDELAERNETDRDTSRVKRPRAVDTLLYCMECEAWFLRRERHDHPHPLVNAATAGDAESIMDRAVDDDVPFGAGDVLVVGDYSDYPADVVVYNPESRLDTGDDPTDDEPEQLGSYYTVEVSKTVEYRYTIPAYSKHRAKQKAEERTWDDRPHDAHSVHTRVDEGSPIYEGDDAADELGP
jgi:hypothetical protein